MNDTAAKVQHLIAVAIDKYVDDNYGTIRKQQDGADIVKRLRETADSYEQASRDGTSVQAG